VLLSSRVPTAAAEAIVFHSHSVLGFLEWKLHFLASKDVTVEVLAKYLSSLIVYFVLGVNHYHVLDAHLEKYPSDQLWVTGVDKYQFRNGLFFR
jgi:hypothetical protein